VIIKKLLTYSLTRLFSYSLLFRANSICLTLLTAYSVGNCGSNTAKNNREKCQNIKLLRHDSDCTQN